MKVQEKNNACMTDISESDILEAMKGIPGYLDVTPADFRMVYRAAYQTAMKRIKSSIRAGDIMTRDVIIFLPDTPLREAAETLNRKKISGAPVVNEDKHVLGVVSERDFPVVMGLEHGDSFMAVVARCLSGRGCPAVAARKQTVAELMSSPAITMKRHATLYEISAIMMEKVINRIPIVDDDGRLIGIVTRSSVIESSCMVEL